jgi:hypothetical protein
VQLVTVPGSSLHVASDIWGVAEFVASLRGAGTDAGPTYAWVAHEASPEQGMRIGIPDIGADASILLRYAPTEGGSTTICGEA